MKGKETSSSEPDPSIQSVTATTERSRDPIQDVCSSAKLDALLDEGHRELKVSYSVPKSLSSEFVSEVNTDLPVTEMEPSAIGVMAGLGIKRKVTGTKETRTPITNQALVASKKAKTLSEKRDIIQDEIMKYGLAEVEKMYPRQTPEQAREREEYFAGKRAAKAAGKPLQVKMKPKPVGMNFEEVDVRHILKPASHDKYIHEPSHDSVVYISRRNGIVPLSSLCKDSHMVMSSNMQLIQGRNVKMGKPSVFFKHQGRLVALGGSRQREKHRFRIIDLPSVPGPRPVDEVMRPFEMDAEYAKFVAKAVTIPDGYLQKPAKVDIRSIKKQKRVTEEEKSQLSAKTIVSHMLAKFNLDQDEPLVEETVEDDVKPKAEPMDVDQTDETDSSPDNEEEALKSNKIVQSISNHAENKENVKPFNLWADGKAAPRVNPEEIEFRAIVTDEFKAKFDERLKNPIAGVDLCDVSECFCKEESASACITETVTPVSGSQTPSNSAQKESLTKEGESKTKTKLTKVKRALKSLGVNFYEFDEAPGKDGDFKDCFKEFCRLGCICDSIASKATPPTHCGKVECMLHCFCSSEDAIKYGSARKVGISPAGAAKLRSSSQRFMAAEEKKFQNTVVSTGGGQDLVMLGTSGRQKRERKVPSRYQDSEEMNAEIKVMSNKDKTLVEDFTAPDPELMKMVKECLKDETIKKCITAVPFFKVNAKTQVWCMFHCQYSCPCLDYENPLDYAPDCNEQPKKAIIKRSYETNPKVQSVSRKDIPNHERPAPKSVKLRSRHKLQMHSARTAGLAIKPCNLLRLPYKVVKKKVNSKSKIKCGSSSTLGVITNVQSVGSIDETKPMDLTIQPKGTVQHVRLDEIKRELHDENINVWCYVRPSRPLLFVAKNNESPYVSSAENIKNINPARLSSLPSIVRHLLTDLSVDDYHSFATLTHNGIVWEMTAPSSGFQVKEEKIGEERGPAMITEIDASLPVMKLPLGLAMVTMQRQGQKTMQIKLPATTKSQHWCTIRVDNAEGSIQCPGSSIALKCNVLKQAASIAMKENTTVRIPIAMPGEAKAFGVYAVPGLATHVFVGPFSSKEDSDKEVICLDEDDDEIQEISSTHSSKRKQRLQPRSEQGKVSKESTVKDLVHSIMDQAVASGEHKRQKRMFKDTAIAGRVPMVVASEDSNSRDIIEVDTGDSDYGLNQSERVKHDLDNPKLPYLNPHLSNFGKVVIKKDVAARSENIVDSKTVILRTQHHEVILNKRPNGVVTFKHPEIPEHEVYSASIDDAKKWMDDFEQRSDKLKAQSKSGDDGGPKLQLKPLASLVSTENGKTRQEIIHPDGKKSIAIFINEPSNELSKLYYDLGTEVYASAFKKTIYRAQILQKAKDTALMMTQEEKRLQSQKKALMLKRKKLFENFTVALQDLPLEVKKQKLQELKCLVRRRDSTSSTGESVSPNSIQASEQVVGPKMDPSPPSAPSRPPPEAQRAAEPQVSPSPSRPTPYSDVTGLKTVKKDGKVLRPMNAFMLWAKDHRRTLIANGYDGATVSKMLADEWKVLSDGQKQKYYHEAEHLKNLHQLQHPDYKYSPRARKSPKKGSGTAGKRPVAPKRIAPAASAGIEQVSSATPSFVGALPSTMRMPQLQLESAASITPLPLIGHSPSDLAIPLAVPSVQPQPADVDRHIETISID